MDIDYRHIQGRCPAFGKKCKICFKMNHFSQKCRNKKPINMITEESDEEFVCMEIVSDKDKWYEVKVDISGKEVLLKVDSGAQCNVMGLQQYLDLDLDVAMLKPSKVSITSFGNNKVEVFGSISLKCMYKSKHYSLSFLIVNLQKCSNILGLHSAEEMGLICRVDSMGIKVSSNIKAVVPQEYWDIFDGSVGCVSQQVDIEVD